MENGTPQSRGAVLVVDDDPDQLLLLRSGLGRAGYDVVGCDSGAAALDALALREFDCVVTDVLMEGMSGIELCERIMAGYPDLPVIVATTSNRIETAIAAIRVAAYDFIIKPVNLDALTLAVARAVERKGLRRQVKVLRELVADSQHYDELLGGSAAMRRVYAMLEQMARSEASVLVTGESGTGKELVARALHRKGPRK